MRMTMAQGAAGDAAPPVQGGAPAAPTAGIAVNPAATPTEMYVALRSQRTELRSQIQVLENRRNLITRRLQQGNLNPADRSGLEQRLTSVDARIAELDKEVAAADAQVAQAAAVPGAVVTPPPIPRRGPSDGEIALGVIGMLAATAVLLPISVAISRRIFGRGVPAAPPAGVPRELGERLTRLEQAVDAVAVEVERIGEGQRFVTGLYLERGRPDTP